ncbi:MAG: hypothetical protein WC243_01645 [Patescibacteria group bacterium]|jgi:hypothetical protein
MRKFCLFLSILFASFYVSKALAATLTLDKIGALSTDGKVYSEWWYTGTDPVLTGKAVAGKSVSVKVGEATESVTANAQGAWSYYLDAGAGDHNIVVSSEGESLSFLLHLGQTLPTSGTTSEVSQSTVPVPSTGVSQVLLITLSLLMMTAGWYLYENKSAKRIFEDSVVKDRN